MQAELYETDGINLSWDWRQNVTYKVYFTENLAHEWTLVETSYWCQSWQTRSTPTGFYKIVAEVKDPVTD